MPSPPAPRRAGRTTVALAALALAMAPAIAGAATMPTGGAVEYPDGAGSAIGPIATGPDGNLWFPSAQGTADSLTVMSPAGTIVATYPLAIPAPAAVLDIAAGPDGNLWITIGGGEVTASLIGKVTTSGQLTTYALPSGVIGLDIGVGPDGNLWFGTNYAGTQPLGATGRIGRITPFGAITIFPFASYWGVNNPTSGPNGVVWFTGETMPGQNGAIGQATTSGAAQPAIPLPYTGSMPNAQAVTQGPDGNMWAVVGLYSGAGNGPTPGSILKVTPSGAATTVGSFSSTGCELDCGIVTGADGNLWFSGAGNGVTRITTAGTQSSFRVATATCCANPNGITAGPDGNVWFVDPANGIGRVATGRGTAIPVPAKSVIGAPVIALEATRRGTSATITVLPGNTAKGKGRITLTRAGTTATLWSGTISPGVTRGVKVTVPRSFPTGKATLRLVAPKSSGNASASWSIRR